MEDKLVEKSVALKDSMLAVLMAALTVVSLVLILVHMTVGLLAEPMA